MKCYILLSYHWKVNPTFYPEIQTAFGFENAHCVSLHKKYPAANRDLFEGLF